MSFTVQEKCAPNLAGVPKWLEHQPAHLRVSGSIPGQHTWVVGSLPASWLDMCESVRGNWCLSHQNVFLFHRDVSLPLTFLSSFPPSFLSTLGKAMENIFWWGWTTITTKEMLEIPHHGQPWWALWSKVWVVFIRIEFHAKKGSPSNSRPCLSARVTLSHCTAGP